MWPWHLPWSCEPVGSLIKSLSVSLLHRTNDLNTLRCVAGARYELFCSLTGRVVRLWQKHYGTLGCAWRTLIDCATAVQRPWQGMLSVVRRHRLLVVDMQFVVHSPSPFPGGAFAWEAPCLMSVGQDLELPCRSLLFDAESDVSVAVSDFSLLEDCQAVCRLRSGSLDAAACSPS